MAFRLPDYIERYMPDCVTIDVASDGPDLLGSPEPSSKKFESREDCCKWCTRMLESGKIFGRRSTLNGVGHVLWDTFMVQKGNDPQLITLNFTSEEDFFNRCSEKVHSLDRFCEETTYATSTLDHVEVCLEGLAYALICHHREGSFHLTPQTVARCLHVANVVSLSCFLFCLRVGTFEDNEGSVIDKSRLMDHLSRLLEKWAWSKESCKRSFHQWAHHCTDSDSEKEEGMKLLYQWTLLPLSCVLVRVECEMDDASVSADQYAEISRLSKWGDELCDFLEEYRTLFKASDDTEFLCDDMYEHYSGTAELHLRLGNHKRATELLETLMLMLDGIRDDDLKITKWGKGEIAYLKPEPIETARKELNVSYLLVKSLIGHSGFPQGTEIVCNGVRVVTLDRHAIPTSIDSRISESHLQIVEEVRRRGLKIENHKQHQSAFNRQLYDIIALIGEERFSEAREIFEHLDLTRRRNRAILRQFLEFLDSPHVKFHTCSRLSLNWETFREKQNLLLDISEALGYHLLTARLLQEYAVMIGIHSFVGLPGGGSHSTGDLSASTLQLWLEKELNLQLTMPVPECVQAVISCLRDPCKSDEHKRDNLPDKLKEYRLMKRSIDIFSELLHNWSTQGTSSEGEWLKLLESQKSVHDSILYFLLENAQLCNRIIIMSDQCNGLRSNSLGSNHSNLHVYRELVQAFTISALVWAERGRARTLLAQLGPWYNQLKLRDGNRGRSLNEELIEFDNDEQAALSSIRSGTCACKRETLFVVYMSQASFADKAPSISFRTAPMAFMTNHQSELMLAVELGGQADEVEDLVNRFYDMVVESQKTKVRLLDDGVVERLHSLLEKLYDLLIEPLSEDPMFKNLDSSATIVFVPDKMLYRVPFALLRDKKAQKYLFQMHPIAISPSLRVLQHCEQRLRDLDKAPLKPTGCILAVGNAAYETTSRLPGTGVELQVLQSCFPGRVKTLEHEEATRGKFLALVEEASRSEEQHVFAFIHLGVHGQWSKTKPGDVDEDVKQYKTGSLHFAKPPPHSGRPMRPASTEYIVRTGHSHKPSRVQQALESEVHIPVECERPGSAFGEVGVVATAPEGYHSSAAEDMLPSEDIIHGGFQWRTRLVVLSACNSLRGQGYDDGEVNLPRALMIAGVPAAVVSQWKVSDVGSPRLMKAFYENLHRGQDVATALQSAMLQLSSDPDSGSANNVFEWGSFLVWGLPTVQLPKELLTENARKALPAKQRAALLRCDFNSAHFESAHGKALLLNALKTANNFLEATYNASVLEDEVITDAVAAILKVLLARLEPGSHLHEGSIQLAEDFFNLLPFERLQKIEFELENSSTASHSSMFMYNFRNCVMYTMAMKGSHLIALEYVNKMQTCFKHGNVVYMPDRWVNGAIILRLMGKYGEALKLFDGMLANGEDYECLIQASYLKYLMEDKSGALEYARRAKKVESPETNMPGYGAFSLGFKALPDQYRQWLLNVVDITGASSSSIWDVLTVQLPKEQLQTEHTNKAFAANQQIESLRWKFSYRSVMDDNVKLEILKALNAVEDFLTSAYSESVLVDEAIVGAIIAAEHLMEFCCDESSLGEAIALVEEIYALLPSEQLTSVELKLGRRCSDVFLMIRFRMHLMYTLAMKGNHEIALEYANKMVEVIQNLDVCDYDESIVQFFKTNGGLIRQERAVILRLMGKYEEALKEFDDLLAPEEDYECLIQMSYLKSLMKDEKGSLEYALRAKKLEGYRELHSPRYGAFILGCKALPDKYRQWCSSVVDESQRASSTGPVCLASVSHCEVSSLQ